MNKPVRVEGEIKSSDLESCKGIVELPPVDISKIKTGDEVWVRCKICQMDKDGSFMTTDKDFVIAHIPQVKDTSSEPKVKVELPEKIGKVGDVFTLMERFQEAINQLIDKIAELEMRILKPPIQIKE